MLAGRMKMVTLLRMRADTPESENVIVGERSYGTRRREIDSGECHTRNGILLM